jgi:squalene cyclase
MAADYPDKAPIEKGVKLIMSRQQPNGEWLQEAIEGMLLNCSKNWHGFGLTQH